MLAVVRNAPLTLPVEDIEVGARSRSLSESNVEKLMKSISELGLINPILVWRAEGALRLAAGLHRLEAMKRLGWTDIPIRMVTAENEAEALLAEIDENLCREELGKVEFAANVAKREVAFLELASKRHGRTFETLADLHNYEESIKSKKDPACQVGSRVPDSFIG